MTTFPGVFQVAFLNHCRLWVLTAVPVRPDAR